MDNHFEAQSNTVKMISEKFLLNTDSIVKVNDGYNELINNIPYQYLAHIIRTIEEYVRRKVPKADFFRITCKPIKDNPKIKDLASAKYHKPYSFDIVYDGDMPEIKKRVCIAHELGHLLVCVMLGQNFDRQKHEPLSSVYGILITLHKKFCQGIQKTSELDEKIIQDFKDMTNLSK